LQAYFGTGEDSKKLQLPAKGTETLPDDFPEALKDLVRSAFQGLEPGSTEFSDAKIIEVLRSPEIVKDPDADEVEFLNGGAPLMSAIQKALTDKEQSYQEYKSYNPETEHSYTQLMAGRDAAIKFFQKYGAYQSSPVTPVHHFQDYVDMVQDFASDLNYLETHARTHIDSKKESDVSLFAASDITDQATEAEDSHRAQETRVVADTRLDRAMRSSFPDMFASFDRIMGLISEDDFGMTSYQQRKPTSSFIEEMLGFDDDNDQDKTEEQRRLEELFNPFSSLLS
jgi:hypothetical protein